MSVTLQVIVNGLQIGAVYVLFAVGLTLIFGVMKIVQFSHGEMFTGAAFAVVVVVGGGSQSTNLPTPVLYVLAFVTAIVVVGAAGYLMYRFLFARFAGDMISGLLVAVGLALSLQVLYRIAFGSTPQRVPQLVSGNVRFLGASITAERLLILVLAIAVTAALAGYLKYTRMGLALRAVSEDQEAAELQGINYQRLSLSGFLLGSLLAATAGVLIAPATVVFPLIGVDLLMKGFIIIILGGLGNIVGAILAGFLLGLVESVAASTIGVTYSTIFSFVAVIFVLLLRPQGLLGRARA